MATETTARHSRGVADRTLKEVFVGRSNSLGFLRWLFACMVVVDHSFPIGGFNHGVDPTWSWTRGQDSLGGIAVAGFFIISGFLVTRSWFSSKGTIRFMWRRFLRIFPAFWCALIVVALIFAPLAWRHERGGLWGVYSVKTDSAFHYVTSNMFLVIHQWDIGGLFANTPYVKTGFPVAWNGSMWTLIYEFKCYIFLAILGAAGLLRKRAVVLVLALASYVMMVSWQINPNWAPKVLPILVDPFVARFLFLFLLGSVFSLYSDKIVIDDRIGVLALLTVVYTLHEGGWLFLGYPALAYSVVWLAIRLPMHWFDRPGDFSYGTYIWAFPLQMLLVEYGMQRHGLLVFIAASLLSASVVAFFSWHLIEKPAMSLKNWQPPLPWTSRTHNQRSTAGSSLDEPTTAVPAGRQAQQPAPAIQGHNALRRTSSRPSLHQPPTLTDPGPG